MKHRYTLERSKLQDAEDVHKGAHKGTVMFVMLNPSTADGTKNDATLRRCVSFATDWGYDHLVVTNLFSLRATKPDDLWSKTGPARNDERNDDWIEHHAHRADTVVCAWGAFQKAVPRAHEVLQLLRDKGHKLVYTIGDLSQSGHPRHPLRIPSGTLLHGWRGYQGTP